MCDLDANTCSLFGYSCIAKASFSREGLSHLSSACNKTEFGIPRVYCDAARENKVFPFYFSTHHIFN